MPRLVIQTSLQSFRPYRHIASPPNQLKMTVASLESCCIAFSLRDSAVTSIHRLAHLLRGHRVASTGKAHCLQDTARSPVWIRPNELGALGLLDDRFSLATPSSFRQGQ